MIGNDVVDLEDPETRPETFRPRFDERVFDPVERRAIAHDPRPHARRWAHWAAKEAAYKLARQLDERQVSLVQVSHGRHKRDVLPVVAPLGHLLGQFLPGMYDLHAQPFLQEKQCSGSG